jgi:hypothetical protein
MQSTTTRHDATMKQSATHLYRRLTILGVTAALFVAIVPDAFAQRFVSDERLKVEIEPVHDALARLRTLRTA